MRNTSGAIIENKTIEKIKELLNNKDIDIEGCEYNFIYYQLPYSNHILSATITEKDSEAQIKEFFEIANGEIGEMIDCLNFNLVSYSP